MIILGILLATAVFAAVVYWWAEGYIGATEGIILFAVYGGLIFGLFTTETIWGRILVLIPLVTSAIWSIYLARAGSLRSYHRQKARQYQTAIDFDPRNFAARARLAQTFYALGNVDRAIAEMQMAVDISPMATLAEQHTLKGWQQEERLRRTRNIMCYKCGRENERGLKHCSKCGSELRIPLVPAELLRRNIHQFAVVTGGLALAVVSLALLPPRLALLPIACGLIAAAGWSMLQTRK